MFVFLMPVGEHANCRRILVFYSINIIIKYHRNTTGGHALSKEIAAENQPRQSDSSVPGKFTYGKHEVFIRH